ncbi:hypothetical protein VTP01DRAFT_9847 [Rhizomucor pusillus]|uniref:uncharacterized protein n=1 Tax=Rhizomucor pusillus TaxID=4840 RepID=UPI0037442A9E
MNQLPRTVPWTTYQELEQVRSWLYSECPEEAQLGVDRIKAWSARGKIPVSLLSTASLISAKLHDFSGAKLKLSSSELRLMYGMALIRFVNGAVDSAQRSAFALNLYQIARIIGLPARFIEIRHALSHEELPTLPVLRDACVHALQWLYEFFWKVVLPESLADSEIGAAKKQQLLQTVQLYKKTRKTYLKELNDYNSGRRPDSTPYKKALKELQNILNPVVIKEGLVPVLLEAGGLVPAGKSKRASMKSMNISEELLELWIPLLRTVSNVYPDFGNYLLVQMAEKLDTQPNFVFSEKLAYLQQSEEPNESQPPSEDSKGSSYMLTLVCWIQFILQNEAAEDTDKIFDETSVDGIMEACLRRPNYYTRSVLQTIISIQPELEEELQPFLRYFERILTDSPTKTAKDRLQLDENAMQTELEMLMEQMADWRGQDYKDSAGSSWKRYDTSKWTPCPIGTLPGGSVPKLDLRQRIQ